MNHPIVKICSLVLLIALSGCSITRKTKKTSLQIPTIESIDVHVKKQSQYACCYVITLKISNPNNIALPLVKADYQLKVAGAISRRENIKVFRTLPIKATQTVELTIAVPQNSQGSYTVQGNLFYKVPGKMRAILTESGIALPKISFAAKGQL